MKLLDYKLPFSHCLGQAVYYGTTATCVVSMGECLRGHDDECSVRNGEKVGFRSASSFICSLSTGNKNICLPSQVLLELGISSDCLITAVGNVYTVTSLKTNRSFAELHFCGCCQCSTVLSTASSGSISKQQLQHLQYSS